VLDNPSLKLAPQSGDDNVPMIRDKNGRMVPDPFAAQAAQRRKGIAMKEHANLVKNLRRLLETEVSQAEVMMAAKGFAQELQEMVEKIGRLQNEDLPPVTDQMRETYGMESASAFQTQIYGALQSVMDALYTAKTQVDDAVGNMAATGQVSAETDMDMPVDGMDDGMDDMDTAGGEEDLDNIGGDMDMEPEDEFGGEEALGRAKKMESVLQKKVMEMKKLVAKAKKLKEANFNPNDPMNYENYYKDSQKNLRLKVKDATRGMGLRLQFGRASPNTTKLYVTFGDGYVDSPESKEANLQAAKLLNNAELDAHLTPTGWVSVVDPMVPARESQLSEVSDNLVKKTQNKRVANMQNTQIAADKASGRNKGQADADASKAKSKLDRTYDLVDKRAGR